MAKAKAICTCATCGAQFIKERICNNRRDADRWSAWAVDNYVECTKCWGKRKAAEEREKPFTITAVPCAEISRPAIRFDASGDTYPHKDDLKQLRYRWEESPYSSKKLWTKTVVFSVDIGNSQAFYELIRSEVANAIAIGAAVTVNESSVELSPKTNKILVKMIKSAIAAAENREEQK